jgi:hypothetical protein
MVMIDRNTEHLRVLIANERKDRLALVVPIVVGSPGGISPPGSHGSRRDSLPSPGSSHQPSVGADPLPVGE